MHRIVRICYLYMREYSSDQKFFQYTDILHISGYFDYELG